MTTQYDADALVQAHRLYDQYVDVVSAFEWVFTEVPALSDTVTHFERFPRVDAPDGNPSTPDFSVVFDDGSALVGELARIALREESVDSLCHQIGRYDTLTHLPGGADGALVEVDQVDVLLLVPIDIGTDVVRRVLVERLQEPEHFYAPGHPPCIVQYVPQPDKYVFQRRADDGNGQLRENDRAEGIGGWLLKSDFKPPAGRFAHVKARSPFMNDPVAPLYLASQLWTKVFPVMVADAPQAGDYRSWIGTTADLVATISELYGRVSTAAVREALELLVATRSAQKLDGDRWRVAWGDLASRPGEDVADLLAHRTEKPPAKGPVARLKQWYSDNDVTDPAEPPPKEDNTLF